MSDLHRRTFLAAAIASVVAGSASAGANPVPVIFDTDIGGDVDDTWAILQLLRRPELDLKLVSTEAGNALYRTRLTAKLLTLAGRSDVTIAMGQGPGDGKGPQDAWLGAYQMAEYAGPVRPDAAQAIVDTVMASPEPVTIIAVGPLTELAAALKLEPDLAKNARFVGMHGAVRVGYGGSSKVEPEYNVRVDPAALQTVFDADWISCSITPLDTCGLLYLEGEEMRRVRGSTDPFARAVIANSEAWLPNAPWMPKDFDLTQKSSTLFDNVAVVMACDESDLVMETLKLRVTPEGMTVIDEADGRPVRVASSWKDLAGFKAKLIADLTRHPDSSTAT
ncbi:inosine-uridine preferring nucleoside hydrolase family protein [Asticcacaulis biprosthecium C19]|uniref:Inosine-uridine preferring nucleoside hydrolase family protein n=1 Tax=Asticcacaulis biprosthecium C19 TaxID=715226 RepID=F4QPB6_9CAUL|nr:nucleoside hydrolase [Asticcacaulis biprosthecium]EGF91174.1 inosine-uridine preferring nucleoside hydrolase family protein [Asticcacaulis biprosthecium C19]